MIYLVRHGQTVNNQKKLLSGRAESELNGEGRAQAAAVGKYFAENGIRFDRVYSSPLSRAVETAQLIAGNTVPVKTDERLLEMDYGPYEGMSLENLAPEVVYFFQDFVNHPEPEGMESLDAVVRRLGDFLETELAPGARCPVSGGENILISTHAIAMKGALEYLTPESRGSYWSKYIGNCAVYVTDLLPDGFTVPVELPITQQP